MSNTQIDETTPDQLMEHFRGRSLKSIFLFTLVVHAVVLIGTSVPYLWKTFAGADSSELSKEEKVKVALQEARASLSEIAEEHGLTAQELSSRFASGAPKALAAPETAASPPTEGEATGEPAAPKSALEKELDVKAKGPTVPSVEDEEEDLFK